MEKNETYQVSENEVVKKCWMTPEITVIGKYSIAGGTVIGKAEGVSYGKSS